MSKKSQAPAPPAAALSTPPDEGVTLELGPPDAPPELPPTAEAPTDPINAVPVLPEGEAAPPAAAASDEGVVVATSAGQNRVPRYRVLATRRFWWAAQPIDFRKGETFDASTHPPVALKAFMEAGLEIEQIE